MMSVRPLVALLVALAPACSSQPHEQEVLTTTLYDPRKASDEQGPSPPRLGGEADGQERPGLIVLQDRRCTDRRCDTTKLVARLRTVLPGLRVTTHDWSDERCRELLDRYGLRYLPAYLLDGAATREPGFRAVAAHTRATPRGNMRYLAVKASFDPRAEICDNGRDDTGNGRVDCDDPGCKGKVVCRPEVPRRLELFVMSRCPYGMKALDSMAEVLDALGRDLDFRIHYIAEQKGEGFGSLHGQPEVDEDIRELCAIEHFGARHRYMDYIWCRNRDMKKPWQRCTGKGIDRKVLERCATGAEGRRLLREDLALAKELGIGASPTWLANNRFEFHGVAPEAIKQGFCRRNKGQAGCERRLSETSPVPEGVCD